MPCSCLRHILCNRGTRFYHLNMITLFSTLSISSRDTFMIQKHIVMCVKRLELDSIYYLAKRVLEVVKV